MVDFSCWRFQSATKWELIDALLLSLDIINNQTFPAIFNRFNLLHNMGPLIKTLHNSAVSPIISFYLLLARSNKCNDIQRAINISAHLNKVTAEAIGKVTLYQLKRLLNTHTHTNTPGEGAKCQGIQY